MIRQPTEGSLLLSFRRRRLALRRAAGRLRCGRLGGLVLVTLPRCCVVSATVAAAVAAAVAAGTVVCSTASADFFLALGPALVDKQML